MAPMTDPVPALQSSESVENPTLLIVDDSRLMRHALKKILSADFNLVEAADGEEAWAMLQAEPRIQAVFSDLSMPNLDGYGLLERVRNSGESRISGLPFIVITGKEGDDASLRAEAQALGANEIVCKPFKSEEIIGMTITFLSPDGGNDTEAEAQRQAEEAEALRLAEEIARLAAEQEARRVAEEAEAQRQAEETARLAAEQEARRAAEEAAALRQAEETARLAAEQEARRIAEEAEALRQAEETARLAAEQETRRAAEDAEVQRQAEETARRTVEVEARRIAEEAEALRQAEETARLAAEQEACRVAEEAASQQPVQEELFDVEALEEIQLVVEDTAEQAANDTESDCANAADEAASYTELPDTDYDLFDTAATEPQRFPFLMRTCIRLALPFMHIGNRLLRLKKDKRLSELRKRL